MYNKYRISLENVPIQQRTKAKDGEIFGFKVPNLVSTIASYTPFLGSAMDVYDAIKDPTASNIGWAAASVLTDIIGGRIVAKGVKAATKYNKVAKIFNKMTDNDKLLAIKHGGDQAVRNAETQAMSMYGRNATNAEKHMARTLEEKRLKRELFSMKRKGRRKYDKVPIDNMKEFPMPNIIIPAAEYLTIDAFENFLQQANKERRSLENI